MDNPERLKALCARSLGDGIRHIDDRLRRLPDRACRNHFVRQRIDRGNPIINFEANIDARAVSGRPYAMRQLTDWNGRDFEKSFVR
jgi:hypothetical protein